MALSPKALYDWYRNTLRNPKYRWWIILATLAYLVSPIDVIPDFLPIAGQIDDLMLVSLLIAELSQLALDFYQKRPQKRSTDESTPGKAKTTVDIPSVSVDER
ncbi:hypothetical protein NIES970_04870 [[Synechococcus] sp. NIES-970]|uniref:YkvA family protein n=1 Tax=Picosynechococcus sp. NKBG15041c TaxID=1407650 RepID=UPI0003FBA23F|nr:YkvA family protein [Picosynechococcus sp. NKBG15041c]BAW95578.1 hypothetical protein NIES970_04870 [[Synechococcus] sp. NIES-970]